MASGAGCARSRPIGSSVASIISRLPMSFSLRTAVSHGPGNALELGLRVRADPVRVNTRGFRLHGYFQAGDCSSSRNEE